ncbi:hypothetical protein [Chroococcidiopsis sp.]|uniref:hypothetical protein n=1 Tax=Chroococcidiopsis sp. TaxID=3088168 RepID=UPI003F3EEFCA
MPLISRSVAQAGENLRNLTLRSDAQHDVKRSGGVTTAQGLRDMKGHISERSATNLSATKKQATDEMKKARKLEAQADKLNEYVRGQQLVIRQQQRIAAINVRHSGFLMQADVQQMQLSAQHSMNVDRYGLQTEVIQGGSNAYHNEMQDNSRNFLAILTK